MKKGFISNIGSMVGAVTGAVGGVAFATAGVAKATVCTVSNYLRPEEEKPMQIGTPYNFKHLDYGVNADFANRQAAELDIGVPVLNGLDSVYTQPEILIYQQSSSFYNQDIAREDEVFVRAQESESEVDEAFDALYDDEDPIPAKTYGRFVFLGLEIGDDGQSLIRYDEEVIPTPVMHLAPDFTPNFPPPSFDEAKRMMSENAKQNAPCMSRRNSVQG